MAVVNMSYNEKTIKGMFSMMSTDNYSIDSLTEYCQYKTPQFDIAYKNILDDYREYFNDKLIEIDVDKKFYYSPSYFAYNYYGTPDLDWAVLYFSNITTLYHFNKPKIKILPREKLLELNKIMVENKAIINRSYLSPTRYVEEL